MMETTFLLSILEFFSLLFIFVVGLGLLFIVILFLLDISQTKNAVRRNFPIIGRLRGIFIHLGAFFRQYFFAMDREEMPFNREQRNWVVRATHQKENAVGFGSTRDLSPVGTIFFVNCPFPTMRKDAAVSQPLVIGADCPNPYPAPSFFNISGMSYGAISRPAVRSLSRGAKMANVWYNTGEGGLSEYHLEGDCDLVFQIGTAKYGVRDAQGQLSESALRAVAAHPQVRMFELKLSQGAKPGKGGILPGDKVSEEISKIRGIPAGQDSLSPNRHPEINSVDQLLDMIHRIRSITEKPVGIKAVLGAYGWLDELFERIHQRGLNYAPDFFTVDSADGGTGAAPMSLLDYVGLPLRESLPMLVDCLDRFSLRPRIRVVSSGKLINPAEVAWALCMGADFVVSARGFMFSLGCIQAMQCHKNTCPTGITTHNIRLQRGLNPEDKAVRVMSYVENLCHEVCVIAHSCGLRDPRGFRRYHARIVGPSGQSVSCSELFPPVAPPMVGKEDVKQAALS